MRDFIYLGERHSYSAEVATEIGIQQTVILESINHWVLRNEKRGINLHDGKYWVEATVADFEECFPYFSRGQLNLCITKLKDAGYIETGHFCEDAFDRTTWYTITEKGKDLLGS